MTARAKPFHAEKRTGSAEAWKFRATFPCVLGRKEERGLTMHALALPRRGGSDAEGDCDQEEAEEPRGPFARFSILSFFFISLFG
jgi:hypothetical protein